jgi:two-component system sensor histidine kinase YesM
VAAPKAPKGRRAAKASRVPGLPGRKAAVGAPEAQAEIKSDASNKTASKNIFFIYFPSMLFNDITITPRLILYYSILNLTLAFIKLFSINTIGGGIAMNKRPHKIAFNSIRFKLITGAVCILFILVFLLLYDNFYAAEVIHDQVAKSNKNLLAQYMTQIDANLSAVDSYLSGIAGLNSDIFGLSWGRDDNERLLAKANLVKMLRDDIIAYHYMDSMFIYLPEHNWFIYSMNNAESYTERDAVRQYIAQLTNNEADNYSLSRQGWKPEFINGQYYLLQLHRTESAYVGAWVRVKELLHPLDFTDTWDGGASMLVTTDGQIMAAIGSVSDENINVTGDLNEYYLTGTRNSYLLVGSYSSQGNFNLVALIPDEKIMENLTVLRTIIIAVSFGSILLVTLCLFLLNKMVVRPINNLLSVMNAVGEGNFNLRAESKPGSDEFIQLNKTFNKMVEQIHDLRVDVYEEQLNVQRAELRYLQMQVNPHFFLNSLNIIYRMAQVKKYDLIQEMVLCLLNYFRFMFKRNSIYVSLKEETEHVKNYMRIQELRLPGHFSWNMFVDSSLLERPVPTLIIQSLVENAVKYAISLDDVIEINVDVSVTQRGDKPYMQITVWDTGNGFEEYMLHRIQMEETVTDGLGEHTGLLNLKKRLAFLYKSSAEITFSNRAEGGAVICIIIPIIEVSENEFIDC